MRALAIVLGLLVLGLSAPAIARAAEAPPDAWVYEREPFKVQFDHDGSGVGYFLIEIDGTAVAQAGPDQLLQRTVTFTVPTGLEIGPHTIDVLTVDEAGVVTAKAKTLRLDVRARRADQAVDNLRVVRGTGQEP